MNGKCVPLEVGSVLWHVTFVPRKVTELHPPPRQVKAQLVPYARVCFVVTTGPPPPDTALTLPRCGLPARSAKFFEDDQARGTSTNNAYRLFLCHFDLSITRRAQNSMISFATRESLLYVLTVNISGYHYYLYSMHEERILCANAVPTRQSRGTLQSVQDSHTALREDRCRSRIDASKYKLQYNSYSHQSRNRFFVIYVRSCQLAGQGS